MKELVKAVGKWLRLGATRLVLQPAGREVPLSAEVRPGAIADLAAESEAVEAYKDAALVGVWRRPAESTAPADPQASMASMLSVQAAFLKEMMGLQVASLRGVREAMETAAAMRPSIPAMLRDEDDGGSEERDTALLAALMRPAAPVPVQPPAPNGKP